MRSVLVLFSTALLLSVNSCDVKTRQKEGQAKIQSDTLFPFVIKLLEDVSPKSIYESEPFRLVEYRFIMDSDSVPTKIRTPIASELHERLDSMPIIDSIFGKEVYEKYRDLNKVILSSNYPKLFIQSKDSLNKQMDEWYESERKGAHFSKFYTLSAPILSSDANFLLVEVDKCGCMMCGSGDSFIFQRSNGKWTLFRRIGRWIS